MYGFSFYIMETRWSRVAFSGTPNPETLRVEYSIQDIHGDRMVGPIADLDSAQKCQRALIDMTYALLDASNPYRYASAYWTATRNVSEKYLPKGQLDDQVVRSTVERFFNENIMNTHP